METEMEMEMDVITVPEVAERARLRVEPISRVDAWAFYRNHPAVTTAYDRPDFVDLIAETTGRQMLRLGVFGADGLEAVAQLGLLRHGPLTSSEQTEFRSGLMCRSGTSLPEVVRALGHELGRRRLALTTFSLAPQISQEAPGLDGPFQSVPTCLLGLDRGTPERVKPERVRRAIRRGLRFEAASADHVGRDLPRLLRAAHARSGTHLSTLPDSFFAAFWDLFHEDAGALFTVALLGDLVAGINVGVRQGTTLYGLYGAREYALPVSVEVSAALLTDEARRAYAMGCTRFDLAGGPPGIVAFKRGCGAEVSSYYDVQLRHPVLGVAQQAWRRARALRRRAA
jgi:hypothetical protein